jgi:diguanylate cyclase (GGDEF)-like protein
MPEKLGQVLVFKKSTVGSVSTESIVREKQESEGLSSQSPRENGFLRSGSRVNLQQALNRLTAVTKSLENKIKQAELSSSKIGQNLPSKKVVLSSGYGKATEQEKQEQGKAQEQIPCEVEASKSDSQINLKNALRNLTAAAKKLEFEIKQAGASTEKIGQILLSKKIITEHDLDEALKRKRQAPQKYLGQILCEMGLPQSLIIKGIHYSNKRKQLGQVLVELNVISAEQLNDNLLQQTHLKHRGVYKPLGTLLAENGIISEEHYIHALSAHFSMPTVMLKDYEVKPSLQKIIGEKYALENHIIVISNSKTKVTAAVADPHLSVIETLEKALPRGKNIYFYLAKASEIEVCLSKIYAPFRKSVSLMESGYPLNHADNAGQTFNKTMKGVKPQDAQNKKTATNDDVLLDLPGIRLAKDRLSMSIRRARRDKNLTALMFVDLYGLKTINDDLGDDAGDYVLREVVKRILSCVRDSDTVALGGADEFLVIANGIHTPENASQIARNIITLISQPIIFDGNPAVVQTNIAIALCPFDGEDIDQLARQADEAMCRKKNTGKNGFCFINNTVNNLWCRS